MYLIRWEDFVDNLTWDCMLLMRVTVVLSSVVCPLNSFNLIWSNDVMIVLKSWYIYIYILCYIFSLRYFEYREYIYLILHLSYHARSTVNVELALYAPTRCALHSFIRPFPDSSNRRILVNFLNSAHHCFNHCNLDERINCMHKLSV